MQKDQLHVIGFFSRESEHLKHTRDLFKSKGINFTCIELKAEVKALEALIVSLQEIDPSRLCLMLDLDQTLISKGIDQLVVKFEKLSAEVVFAASPYFLFDNQYLRYFYWKHYPRLDTRYNYLDASVFAGKCLHLKKLLEDIKFKYPENFQSSGNLFSDAMSRYYADQVNGCFEAAVHIKIDHKNLLFSSTRLSFSSGKRHKSWVYDLLYRKNEQDTFSAHGAVSALRHPYEVRVRNHHFSHNRLKTRPLVISLASDPAGVEEYVQRSGQKRPDRLLSLRLAMSAHVKTLRQLILINRVNKGKLSPERIFRYIPNKSKQLNLATQNLVSRLEQKQPLSFAHYNDGELTFIRDFLNDKNHEKWFGRKQQQYNPLLAERLHEAMQFKKDGYFVGVPCSRHHASLRKLADKIVGDYEYKVQAMTLHHNLAYMPRLLYALRDREVYFFTNEYQDLSFFKHLGIDVNPDRVISVPFKNSYLEYESYSEMRFPQGAVVVLTCGMLAKILTKVWYQNHENLSILAFGSSLDDHIQKENINFELYPNDLPLTKNLHKSRGFLFGYKKTCKECFSY